MSRHVMSPPHVSFLPASLRFLWQSEAAHGDTVPGAVNYPVADSPEAAAVARAAWSAHGAGALDLGRIRAAVGPLHGALAGRPTPHRPPQPPRGTDLFVPFQTVMVLFGSEARRVTRT